ncbi:Catenin-beta-like protein [Coemansia mojavensis]|nr:Catenin-beta-like protein [Coemansia mojavensis]
MGEIGLEFLAAFMDINDIFKETVTNTSLNSGKRKATGAPSLRELKESGYGIVSSSEIPAKKARSGDDTPEQIAEQPSDDEEGGRFFDDGLTAEEKGVMEWVDHMEDMDESLDHLAVQRLVMRLERAVSKNTTDRINHPNNPEKFVESEAELDEALQRLLLLANDVQYLKVLVELEAVPTLVSLVAHENADIALDVIQLAVELTAEDAWNHEGESAEERTAVLEFVSELAQNEFFEVLGQNLRRLNEEADTSEGEADRQGVFQTLTLIENLVSLDETLVEKAITGMKLLEWLQSRITQTFAQTSTEIDPNQQYAAEIVSILLQTSDRLRSLTSSRLMDTLLQCLAKYRKHTPEDDVAMEYLENIIDSICMLVATADGKRLFLELEGVELLVLLQKQMHVARLLSLKILDYVLSPPPLSSSTDSSEAPSLATHSAETRAAAKRYIDQSGLKYLFSILMHHGKGGVQKLHKAHPQTDERAVNCISWLLRLTDQGTPLHWRVLAKFVPSPADLSSWKLHVDRIAELNLEYFERVRDAEVRFDRDEHEEETTVEERYLSRLDAGLFTLQMTDIIIAFISEEPSAREHIELRLNRKDRSLDDVLAELTEYIETKRADSLAAAVASSSAEPRDLSSVLQHL